MLLPTGTPVSLLQATFINPIAGTIYFRQVQGEEVQMWGKFYWIDDTATTVDHNWHIHELAVRVLYNVQFIISMNWLSFIL